MNDDSVPVDGTGANPYPEVKGSGAVTIGEFGANENGAAGTPKADDIGMP